MISAIVPPVNYSRPPNNPGLYADAYPDRTAYDIPTRQPNNKVWQPKATTPTTISNSTKSNMNSTTSTPNKICCNQTRYYHNFLFSIFYITRIDQYLMLINLKLNLQTIFRWIYLVLKYFISSVWILFENILEL